MADCIILNRQKPALKLLTPENGLKSGYTVKYNGSMSGNKLISSNGFYISPAISMGRFRSITFIGRVTNSTNGTAERFRADKSYANVTDISKTAAAETQLEITGLIYFGIEVDVSSLSGNYYIGVPSVGNSLEITSIILK